MRWSVRSWRALRGVAPLLSCLALPAAELAAAPLDPAQAFRVRGEIFATIDGPGCCGNTLFTGRFTASYEIASSGEARLSGLSFSLQDRDVYVPSGFLGLSTTRVSIRCGGGRTTEVATGAMAGPEEVTWPAGRVKVSGAFAEVRDAEDSCNENGRTFTGTNTEAVFLGHGPASGRVRLGMTLSAEIEGATYALRIEGAGRFENRPPEARLAFRYPDGSYPQEGCPAFWRQNEQKEWELVAEANAPEGLVAGLLSYSADADGPWGEADVSHNNWFLTRTGGSAEFLGEGRDAGPFTFGWGEPHLVELLSFDHAGASDAAACSFRVIDTRPPVVTPPAALTTGSTTGCGATPATSPTLSAFLAGASATDVADTTPSVLPPLLTATGAAVTSTTFFPADAAARSVSFRFRDDAGNTATATSTVTVLDVRPPSLSLAVNRPFLNPDFKWWWIAVTPAIGDDCGTVSLQLVAIKSNAPAYDGSDILQASYGSDDRSFYLYSRPAGPSQPRVYTITYKATDAAGNSRLATTTVTVVV